MDHLGSQTLPPPEWGLEDIRALVAQAIRARVFMGVGRPVPLTAVVAIKAPAGLIVPPHTFARMCPKSRL